jgi:hypothetical protein
LPEEEGWLNRYEMRNQRSHKAFTDVQEMLILNLPKVSEENDGRPVRSWLKIIKSRTKAEFNTLAAAEPEAKGATVKKLMSVCPQSRLLCGQTLHLLPFCTKTVRKMPVLR